VRNSGAGRGRIARSAALGGLATVALVAAVISGSGTPHASAAGPLFADGFESGSMNAWTTSTGVVAQQQIVHAGSWAALISSPGLAKADAWVALPTAVQQVSLSAGVNVRTHADAAVLLRMSGPTGASIGSVGIDDTGRLFTRVPGGAALSSVVRVTRNAWHALVLHVDLSGNGAMGVDLDGQPVSSLNRPMSVAATSIGRVEIGGAAARNRYAVVFDDVSADPGPSSGPVPPTPTGLKVTGVPGGSEELSWDDPNDTGPAAYTVYRLDGRGLSVAGTTAHSRYVDHGLAASTTYRYEVDAVSSQGVHSARSAPVSATTLRPGAPPISHVVIIDQENHSFDNVLGALCAQVRAGTIARHQRCDGATTAHTSAGTVLPLSRAADIVPIVDHNVGAQRASIDGGRMDGFDRITGCTSAAHACLSQYQPSQIPNLAALAERYTIADRTFEFSMSPSWVGHIALVAATQDGFQGNNPQMSTYTSRTGPGWGCDSFKDAPWWDGSHYILVPSCIPDRSGAGPYRHSPVPYVPTIFDRLRGAGLSWRIYGGLAPSTSAEGSGSGYVWAICPTFYECFGSAQRKNWVPAQDVVADGAAGKLPNFSIVVPTGANSQHNKDSMTVGDNWIGNVVRAIQSGPDWPSTVIFITYDDCGCFYDHVPPPEAGWGIRVPMVIVSPYAEQGGTDSQPATFASMLTYTEHLFGLAPLASADANAYGYAGSFDYAAPPSLEPVRMVHRWVPKAERAWIRAHPADDDDPT
jgi:phospholipase C